MKNIGAALLKVQQELDPVKKGKKGHNNKYADLPAVLDEAVGKLNDHGIVVMQPIQPASQPNHARVETVLLHADSGESITGAAEVPWRSESKMNDAQSYGSAVTYARRYSLVSILGISTEDDDGQTAHARPTPKSAEPTLAQKTAAAVKAAQGLVDLLQMFEGNHAGFERDNKALINKCEVYPEAKAVLVEAGLI